VTSRWWFPFDRMAEASFRRVPEGWVYFAPSPWLVGCKRSYLLQEEQKAALAAKLRRIFRLLFVAIIGVLGVAMPLAFPAEQYGPFTRLAVASLAGLMLGSAFNAYVCRTIRPLIAGLQPTTYRITRGDVFQAQLAVFSRGHILFFGLATLALFALTALPPLITAARWDPLSICGALLFGAGTLYWLALYIAKGRQSAG